MVVKLVSTFVIDKFWILSMDFKEAFFCLLFNDLKKNTITTFKEQIISDVMDLRKLVYTCSLISK